MLIAERSINTFNRKIMIGIKPKGITKAHLKDANIGQDYWECDFGNYIGPQGPKNIAINYLTTLEKVKDMGVGILFVGPNGPGKTTLAMIIMKYLARAGWDVYCTSLGEIVEQIQRGWKQGEDSAIIERCKRADFLLIDDVGKEHRGQSGFVQTVFDNLIRFRVQHRLPTFLTSNLTKAELEGTYGESVMSLLEGKLQPVTVAGKDVRRNQLKQATRKALC